MEVIKLNSCINVRDISYKNIKSKRLLRGSALDNITDSDIDALKNKYNLKAIIDLRIKEEIENEIPNIPGVTYYNVPIASKEVVGISNGKSFNQELIAMQNNIPDMQAIYINCLMRDKKDMWVKIFDILLDTEEGSVFWHCQQGKDRCGTVAAIIEYALGLDYDTILEDYLLTNESNKEKANYVYDLISYISHDDDLAHTIKNVFLSHKEHLDNAFNYINQEYGSVDNFLLEMCNLTEEKRNKLKQMYLETAF